jgi:hypothetical protein
MTKYASVQHGRFTIDVPEGWADDSTLSFTAPIAEGLAAPLSPKQAPKFQSNLHITVELRPDGLEDAVQFLQLYGDSLRQAGAELEDVAPPAAFDMGGRAGAIVERRVKLNNEAVRQLTAAVFLEHNIIVASANTSESEATREVPRLREILSRVRYE